MEKVEELKGLERQELLMDFVGEVDVVCKMQRGMEIDRTINRMS